MDIEGLKSLIENVEKKVDDISTKLDDYMLMQATHNNAFYECRGGGRLINKIVFILLGVLLAGQIVSGYIFYKEGSIVGNVQERDVAGMSTLNK